MLGVFNTKQVFLSDELGKTDKTKILEFVIEDKILEVGSGSGIHLNMLEDTFPKAQIQGIDISDKVVHSLQLKKQCENRRWNIQQENAMELSFNEKFDTIIFCSVLHEIFSYDNGLGKFSYEALRRTLKSALELLNKGGRIIIRDGIMSPNNIGIRRIKFLNNDGINFLRQYCKDFKGREIKYTYINDNEVSMLVNDAMEFLYTYTWGYSSYEYEVQEQYGYFTKDQYKSFIYHILGDQIKIKYCDSYLQDGYTKALKNKIKFIDENGLKIQLPDSNCLIVIEKII